jgi:hypothetical protein
VAGGKMKEKIIQDEINKIIKSFYDEKGKLKKEIKEKLCYEPVNWDDLKCTYVKKCYVAYIDEADPNAEKFRDYIKRELEKKGYNYIEVITEL